MPFIPFGASSNLYTTNFFNGDYDYGFNFFNCCGKNAFVIWNHKIIWKLKAECCIIKQAINKIAMIHCFYLFCIIWVWNRHGAHRLNGAGILYCNIYTGNENDLICFYPFTLFPLFAIFCLCVCVYVSSVSTLYGQ